MKVFAMSSFNILLKFSLRIVDFKGQLLVVQNQSFMMSFSNTFQMSTCTPILQQKPQRGNKSPASSVVDWAHIVKSDV